MPTLWLGPDAALDISFDDFSSAFADRSVRFLATRPSGLQHVTIEITRDELRPPLFLQPGCYLLENLSPEAARETLPKRGIAGA